MTAAFNHTIPPRADDSDIDPDPADGRMGFLEHLDELRKRIIRSCIAIGAGMLVAFFFHDRIGDFILADDGNEYFFHNSACTGTRFDDLREGQAVTFDRGQGPKGPRGENVRVA